MQFLDRSFSENLVGQTTELANPNRPCTTPIKDGKISFKVGNIGARYFGGAAGPARSMEQ